MSSATLSTSPPTVDEAIEVTPAVRALTESSRSARCMDDWLARIDAVYRDAAGDAAKIPWSHRQPCPTLVNWLNAEAPCLIRPGARTAVVGCGLGEDAELLRERGYDVTAFDVCDSALEWARAMHADAADMFIKGDLRDLPARLRHRFDLVVEVHTLQSLPPENWAALAQGMADLLSSHGMLVAIARGRGEDVPLEAVSGPPWELTARELVGVLGEAGLAPYRALDDFMDGSSPPVRRLRGLFHRA